MKKFSVVALVVIIISIALGTALGLLVQNDQPRNQHFSFTDSALHTPNPIQCDSIPKNYTNWLVISVLGNRTGINFQTVTVYAIGLDIRLDIPLNRTAFSTYNAVNSTYETIIAPLPSYFDSSEVLSVSISYYIAGFTPTSETLPETPILDGNLSC